MKTKWIIATLWLAVISACDNESERPGLVYYNNPVSNESLADPTLIRAADGNFYLYATGTPIVRSSDLVNWTFIGNAFSPGTKPDFLEGGDVWAPDINFIGGKYLMYYSLSKWGEEFANGIGVAISDQPEGPFTDLGKLFTSTEIGVQNSIDPCFIADDGKNYLFWGSFRGIYAIELSADGLSLKPGAEKQKVAGTAYEGTYIHQRNGYFYLFASILTCCEGANSLYTTVVGRSENILGPYTDRRGAKMLNNFHEILIAPNARFAGTGHNSEIVTDNSGKDWILYHAWDKKDPVYRKLMLDRVTWVNDWPVVKNQTASLEAEAPEF